MIKEISVELFIQQSKEYALLDVRAPVEFQKGHIPNAKNLPLLSNEERAQVGTTFKKKGREAAILLGFDLTGDKWRGFIEKASKTAPDKKVCLHCSRGGLRSSIMAWAFDLYGFDISIIEGGYKSYRQLVLQQFEKEYPFLVLGGLTGSRKTEILIKLEKTGEQIIDLEGLAQHQGSAFGSMNKLTQPTQQQFENNLAACLLNMSKQKPIWIEDESRTIGKRVIPGFVWQQMQKAALIELQVAKEQRVDFLSKEYGVLDKDFLIEATRCIGKRLGAKRTQSAIEAIKEDRMADFISDVLIYYDKAYKHGISQRDSHSVFSIEVNSNDLTKDAYRILEYSQEINHSLIRN